MELAGAGRYGWIWVAVVPLVIWAAVRGAGAEAGYPLVPLIAYTPYVAGASLVVAGVAVALRNWAAAAVAALAAAALLAAVLPRAVGDGEELPAGAAELRVLSVNIHHGTADPADVIGLVERFDADVLSVQELTPGFARKLQASGIGRRLPQEHLSLRRGSSGGGLYSRLPLRGLPAPLRVAFRMPRAMVKVAPGNWVRVVEVHPFPPKRCCLNLWRSGIRALPAADPGGPPWILAGDFNATLDFAVMRDLLETGYRDAGEVTGEGLEPTWPDGRLMPPPVTIDHVLADERIAVADYEVEDVAGSDHHAVFARLGVP